jgi:hypothetical protein
MVVSFEYQIIQDFVLTYLCLIQQTNLQLIICRADGFYQPTILQSKYVERPSDWLTKFWFGCMAYGSLVKSII